MRPRDTRLDSKGSPPPRSVKRGGGCWDATIGGVTSGNLHLPGVGDLGEHLTSPLLQLLARRQVLVLVPVAGIEHGLPVELVREQATEREIRALRGWRSASRGHDVQGRVAPGLEV